MPEAEANLTKLYDAVVIGSGAAGGMAAHVLTSHGLQVLLLEAGKKLPIEQELRSMEWPYDNPHRGLLPPDSHSLTDRKSTRLNSSHLVISYAVFCLKKTNARAPPARMRRPPRAAPAPGARRWARERLARQTPAVLLRALLSDPSLPAPRHARGPALL